MQALKIFDYSYLLLVFVLLIYLIFYLYLEFISVQMEEFTNTLLAHYAQDFGGRLVFFKITILIMYSIYIRNIEAISC